MCHRSVFLVTLTVSFLAMGCGASSLKLASKVVNEEDRAMTIQDAEVLVLDETGLVVGESKTAGDGTFELVVEGIDKNKRYELVVKKDLLSGVFRQPINVNARQPAPAQIALPIMGAFRVTIYEDGKMARDLGARLVAAIVSVMRKELVINETSTGNGGIFTVGNLEGSSYKFRIDHPQFYPTETNYIDVKVGEVTELEIPVTRIREGDVNLYRELKASGDWKPVKIAPRGWWCIAEGTLIDGEEGTIPIEAVRVGDVVRAYDFHRAQVVSATVTAIRVSVAHETILIGGGLEVTAVHPVYTQQGWKPALELVPSDVLMAVEGSYVHAGPLQLVKKETRIYDLSVDGPHNFFAAGILVHNKSIW